MNTPPAAANPEFPTHSPEAGEIESLRRSLDTLILISEAAGESLFTDQILQQVMETILRVTGFQSVYFRLHNPKTRCLQFVVGLGLPPELMPDFICFPDDQGIPGIAFQTRQPAYTSNLSTDPRRAIHPSLPVEWESLVAAPLLAGSEAIGTLQLASREPHKWSETELRWLSAIGKQIGMMVHHAQLVERLRDQTVLQERTRLGREIHDGLAQAVGCMALQTKVAGDFLENGQIPQARAKLQEAAETAQTMYDDVRGTLFELRAVISPDAGFVNALREYLNEFQLRYGILATLVIEAEDLLDYPASVLIQLSRILQEALTNVRKHARASHVWVSIESDGAQTLVRVADDGAGCPPEILAQAAASGYGLKIMSERAESIGGAFWLETRPASGLQVNVKLKRGG